MSIRPSVSSGASYLGYYASGSGEATVTGAGSTWTNSGVLYVGYSGPSTLTIADGASVSNTNGYIAYGTTASISEATVTGAGSTWTNSGTLYVGYNGSGTLAIADGASVGVAGTTYVSYNTGSTGSIAFDGGSLSTKGFYADASELSGTGTISANGLVGSGFDSFVFDNSSVASINKVDGEDTLTITVTADGIKTADIGTGIDVINGAQVTFARGYLGYASGDSTAVTVSGNGSALTTSSELYVGYNGASTLTIADGGSVSNTTATAGYIGYATGASGEVTVTGEGSTWTNSGTLYVGYNGSGTLAIADGASVGVAGTTYVSYNTASTGSIAFDGGSLSTKGFYANASELSGTGTISANGLVGSGFDSFVFDNSSVASINKVDGEDTLTVTVTADGTNTADIGTSFDVINGAQVFFAGAYLGYASGDSAVATVSGNGSALTTSSTLYVGNSGTGTLTVSEGASVSSQSIRIGNGIGTTSEVTVSGNGSALTTSSTLYVGSSGTGTLTIADHAKVTTGSALRVYNSSSALNLGLSGSNDTLLKIGSESVPSAGLVNNGTVNAFAIGSMAAGVYTPIEIGSSATYSGTGSYRAFGGTWVVSSSSYTLTINELTASSYGAYSGPLAGLRLAYGDGDLIVALASDSAGTDFTVTEITDTELENLVAAYSVSSTDADVDDALLCFNVSGYLDDYVLLYRASSSAEWGEYDYTTASSFYSEQDGYLSLVASEDTESGLGGFGDYALIASQVPEPAQLAAILGLLALFVAHRRRLRAKR
jgi:T5SS/PEP-CTERM-associated repeat protein